MNRQPRWSRWGLLGVALGMLIAAPALGGRDSASTPRPPLVVEVRYGDSLWTIAKEYGDPERDVRDILWHIRTANALNAGSLQPGDEIKVPADCLP